MTFAWVYLQDAITSPIAWAAFGAGCMFSSACVLLGLYASRCWGSSRGCANPGWLEGEGEWT